MFKASSGLIFFCVCGLFLQIAQSEVAQPNEARAEKPRQTFSSSGYFRYSTWTNASGYLPNCRGLSKAPSNFGRLGHECGYYGDLGVRRQDENWDFSLRAAVFGDGYQPWENSDQDQKEWQLVEAFVEVKEVAPNLSLWLGRRFFRDSDVHIADWYYFAEMIGQGAGLRYVSLAQEASPQSEFSLSHFFRYEAASSELSGVTQKSSEAASLQVLDVRASLRDQFVSGPLGFKNWELKAVASLGQSPAGQRPNGEPFIARKGYLVGGQARASWQEGSVALSHLYGQGALESLNAWGEMFISPAQEARSEDSRARWVLDLNDRVFKRWAHQSLVAHEQFYSGVLPGHRWWGFAQRWTYFFGSYWQGLIELSYQDAISGPVAGAGGSGAGGGASTSEVFESLRRGAIGFVWAPQDHIWSRPQLRVLYQRQDRQDQAGVTSDDRFGYQFELWF